jgi:hypothetical protein
MDNLDKSAIEKVEELVRKSFTTVVGDRTYSPTKLNPVIYEPKADALCIHSLAGLCDFINTNLDGCITKETNIVLVKSPSDVVLTSSLFKEERSRELLALASFPKEFKTFRFGEFYSQEEFSIQFRSLFVRKEGDDFDYVLSYTSKIKEADEGDFEDDGITQKVKISKGVSGRLNDSASLKAIVRLSPYRTFREVDQPESEFLLRVRNKGGMPEVALFEADGGAWVYDATQSIAAYIRDKVKLAVIA